MEHTLPDLQSPEPPDFDRAFLEVLPAAVCVCGRDGRLVYFNRRAAELWGRTPDLGSPEERYCGSHKIFRSDGTYIPHAECPMADVLRTGVAVNGLEVVFERPDGGRATCLVDIAPLRDAAGIVTGAVNCFQDITERKRYQDRLRESERLFRDVLAALPGAIYTTDAAGRITFYNQAAVDLWGLAPELGKNEWCGSWRLYWPDGRPMPHDTCPMAIALKENRIVRGGEAAAERPDGTRVPFLAFPTPLHDEAGTLVGAVNMLVDITQRQRAEAELRDLNETLEQRVAERSRALVAEIEERQAVEAQLHQLQKTEAVGQLTGGVAHDFNNLLTAIMGSLDLIAMNARHDDVRKQAAVAMRAAKRGAKLTHQLLAFSRKQRLEPRSANINELVSGLAEMLLRTLGGTIRVDLALAEGLWPALIDPNQIESALLNLAINARDAMAAGGTLTIETANRRFLVSHRAVDLSPGDYVMVAVTDTGTGMSEEVKARAFDPFFTTKDVGKGSGLGLSQVYGIARQLGGGVEIDSAPGRGTCVRLYLPKAQAPGTALRPDGAAVAAGSPRRRERLLLVDDDNDVREVVGISLRQLGYEVVEAEGSGAALEMLASAAFDLVLMDFAMPRMNGAEAAGIVRSRWPVLPILFITGHADTPALNESIANLAKSAMLRKPFAMADLDATVRHLLEQPEEAPRPVNVVQLRPEAS